MGFDGRKITTENFQFVSLATSPIDLNLHSCTNSFSEYLYFRAFADEDNAEEHIQIAFSLKRIIKKLGIEQVMSYRKITFFNSELVATSGMENILFDSQHTES